jgi:NarL family two-component system response regulator LiaR
MESKIRVLIADDHDIVRMGIQALFIDAGDVEIAGEAGDGRDAVAAAERLRPDVILMDLLMPRMDGVEAIRKIRERQPDARIIILTGANVDAMILAALRAGALSLVDKASARRELLEAVRLASRGEPWIPASLAHQLLGLGPHVAVEGAIEGLTEREVEILRQVATGRTNRQIADAVHVSEGTVRTHVSHILGKLGLANRVEAAIYALRERLVSLDAVT